MPDFQNNDDEGRVRALERLEILDTPQEAPFENIVNLIQQILGVPMCAVSLVDRDRQWFKARRGLGECQTARDISFCTHAIKHTEPFIVPDAHKDPTFAHSPLVTGEPHIRSYAGIPLHMADGYNVGSLCAMDTKPRDFTAGEIDILKQFAKTVVNEMELRQIASVDHLTGVLSRRAWTEQAVEEFKQALSDGSAFSAAIFDLDKFKWINDHFGHASGDLILKGLAQIAAETIRSSDIIGRIGGEEFAILFPDTTAEEAMGISEQLRKAFQEQRFDLGEMVSVTVSIGIAEMTGGDDDLKTLLMRADAALYDAKRQGRNRTLIADGDAQQERPGMVA